MKRSDYLKKKRTRETRKKIISVISAIVVFVTTYALVLPAITLDVSKASQEPGIVFEQMQFKTTASAASVTAADSTVEVQAEETQVEEPADEAPAEEETIQEEPAESSEEETSAVSDEQEEAPAEPEQAETPAEPKQEEAPAAEAETEEVQEDESTDSKSDAAHSSEPAQEEAQTAETQKAAEQTAVDQAGTEATDAAAAATTAETAAEFQIPTLDALDFDEILTGKTAFYYYHPENAEEAENLSSDSVDDWKKADSDTVLAPEDFVRVYLSYEIPAGALNETNAVARYRLPADLELSDKQIKAINKYENGIAASRSGSEHDKYLGAEAIEGGRTPDEKAGDEYISATVKVQETGDGRQELVFTFIPYTVEKNQISYDATGKLTSEGRNVKGFFTFDLTTSQIDFEKTEKETVEKEDGTAEEIQYSEAEVLFADKDGDRIERTLTMAAPAENEEPQEQEPKTLTSEGSDYTVIVSYNDDAQIPDNAVLEVSEIKEDDDEYASYLEQAKSAVDKDKSVNEARFFDITIVSDGQKVEPKAPVNVQINFAGIEQTNTDDTQLLHYKDDKDVEVMDKAEFSKSEEQAVDTVQFETDGFSVYGIVGTEELETRYITADGKTYRITVTYGPDAQIPGNATLSVREITKGTDEYFVYYNKALRAAGLILTDPEIIDETVLPTESTVEVHEIIPFMPDARFFDVSIMVDGIKYEPKAEVEVKVEYDESLAMGSGDTVSSVHFTEDGDELLDAQVSENAEKQVVTHSQDGFSVTGDVVISMTGDADPDDPGTQTARFGALRASGTNAGPDTTKTVTDNGDGTYKIRLDILGEVEHETEVTKANVIIILDTSGSMDETASGRNSRWDYAEAAVNNVASTLLGKNGQDGNPNDLVQMALVTFSNTATTRVSSTTRASDISSALSRIDPSGGTNWEDALQEAATVNFNNDGDATYVIFVSDGNPTFRNTRGSYDQYFRENGSWRDDWQYYNNLGVYGTGNEYDETVRRCYNEALDDAQALVSSGRQLYTIGAFGNVTRMQSLTTEAGAPANHYYSASNADALSAALNEIAEAIEKSMGYTDVSTTDGITGLSSVSANVVEGQATGFKYYKNNVVWNDAPEAKYENSAVTWDLSSLDEPLEDGVTYSVEFDVWPSQESYDLIADLNNGLRDFNTLPQTTKDQINDNGDGTYTLKTNTSLTTTYTKNGVTGTDEWDKGENAMPLPTENISIKKIWNNKVDDHIGDDTESVQLYLTKDGQNYLSGDEAITVAPGTETEWVSTKEIYISVGLISQESDGTYTVREKGHDYSIAEPEAFSYYWNLTSDVYRPMSINGTAHYLVLNDDAAGSDGSDYYVIEGHKYEVRDGDSELTATNDRRSNLNLTKEIDDKSDDQGADKDTLFEYTITVNNPMASTGSAGNINSDRYVWFSVYDPVAGTTVKNLQTNATAESGNTGYYYVESGSSLTVKMKAGWNLRFINLPNDTTYTITETVEDGWTFENAEGSGWNYTTEAADDYSINVVAPTVTGNIPDSNHSYTVTVTNKWEPNNRLTVNKNWLSGNYVNTHGTVTVALYKDGTIITGSVKEIANPATSVTYDNITSFEGLEVREVIVTTEGSGDEASDTVTPIEANGVIAVSGEDTTLGNNKTDTYVVTYSTGTASGNSRTDTVTNTMPRLVVNKNGIGSDRLADAVFKLTGEDGETALTGYDAITSSDAADGNLLNGIYLSNGRI